MCGQSGQIHCVLTEGGTSEILVRPAQITGTRPDEVSGGWPVCKGKFGAREINFFHLWATMLVNGGNQYFPVFYM